MIVPSLVVLAGACAGGFVSGLAGFGTGLVVLGIWLDVLEPAAAATLVVLCSVVSQALTIPAVRHAIDRARVWPMLTAGLLRVPVGSGLLAHLDPDAFRLGMGILLLAFSTFMLLGRFSPRTTGADGPPMARSASRAGSSAASPPCRGRCRHSGPPCAAGAGTSGAAYSRPTP